MAIEIVDFPMKKMVDLSIAKCDSLPEGKKNQLDFSELTYVDIWVCLKMLCTSLYPMVLLIIIPMKNGYNWEYTLFSDKPICWH